MATPVIIPKHGQSVETCIITAWYKKKGDTVKKGELLFSYETDKSAFDEEAQADGLLLEIFHGEGEEVPVLSHVAVIGSAGESAGKKEEGFHPVQEASVSATGNTGTGIEGIPEESAAHPATKEPAQQEGDAGSPGSGQRLRISPRARAMARIKGIDITHLKGSGPNGRIIVRDIEQTESVTAGARQILQPSRSAGIRETATPVPGTDTPGKDVWEDRPVSNVRRLIARSMLSSLQNSAQLTHHLSADARAILTLRNRIKKMREDGYAHNITLNDMICYAVIRALMKHPDVNVHFLGESVRYFSKVHLGIAVDTNRGLMVPALINSSDMTLPELSDRIASLANAAREGKINPDLLLPASATFTVSNLGAYGVEMFTPVINLPQAAILGVNTILERPARMKDGTFGFIPHLGLSLTYDHRVLDGGPATRFLAGIKQEIEEFEYDLKP